MTRTAWPLLLSLFVGCAELDGQGTSDDPSDPADDDTAADSAFQIDWELSEVIPTVVNVRWATVEAPVDDAWVEFGYPDAYSFQAPAIDDGDGGFESTLLGLKPDTEVGFRAVATVGGQEVRSSVVSLVTGSRPPAVPSTSLKAQDADEASGGFVITSMISFPSYSVILDADGEVVWWYTPESLSDHTVIPTTALSQDGRSMVYLASGILEEEEGSRRAGPGRVRLDGTSEELVHANQSHHAMVELSDGTFAVLERDARVMDGEEIEGDRIVERRPDGTDTIVFSVWDHLSFDPTVLPEGALDWTHANALDITDEEDAYYMSLCNLDSIIKVDRASGDILWQLGGAESEISLPDGGRDLFDGQHQFEFTSDGVVVFDNGTGGDLQSRVVEYALDVEAGTAEFVWEYSPDPALFVYMLGDVARLPSGNTLVVWSTSGLLEEVTPAGEPVLEVSTPLGVAFGYARWTDSLYIDK